MTLALESLPDLLRLDQTGEHTYAGTPEHAGSEIARNVVFGGQILAQMIIAAAIDRDTAGRPPMEVKSIHAIFARAGDYAAPIEYAVDRMHDGRTFGSDTVTFSQQGRVVSRGLILWSIDEPDLIRHLESIEMPDVSDPDDPGNRDKGLAFPGATSRAVDGINTWDPGQPVGPAVQHVWHRYPEPVDGIPANQAVLSWATDGHLIGTAMLPHADICEAQAHRTISTGVVSHTLNFHDRFDVSEWLLLSNESVWAGRGRTHGRCNVWTKDGRLAATYTQDNIIRAFGDGQDHTGDYQRIM
jgi:acyl-CoA thioesterase II